MKKSIQSLAKEINVCCGTSCSKEHSVAALNELVTEICFFKNRYDLMKQTLINADNAISSVVEKIDSSNGLSVSEKNIITSILVEVIRNNKGVLCTDISSELNDMKKNIVEKNNCNKDNNSPSL